ncbi:MAG: sugar transferase [Dorea sp.]|nr:sugar transferase [Dorea sp.]
MLRSWDELPDFMHCKEVKPYYDTLAKKRISLRIKRIFDIILAGSLFVILAVPMLIISIIIKLDSEGPAFYRQERITAYGKKFKIHKFRTMVNDADKIGSTVTVSDDNRITTIGTVLRKYRIDELPQLFDVLAGNMSFVGARPEAVKYVKQYTKEMRATLLLPAGITSEASIRYKDEAGMFDSPEDVDRIYVEQILPEKMKYNLKSIKDFSFWGEIHTIIRTICVIFLKKCD